MDKKLLDKGFNKFISEYKETLLLLGNKGVKQVTLKHRLLRLIKKIKVFLIGETYE